MPSPFPGMDPYLEDPALWPDFHWHLVTVLDEVLRAGLVDRYRLSVGTRCYLAATEKYLEIRRKPDGRLITLIEGVSPGNKTTAAGRQEYLETRRVAREAQANLVEIDLVSQGKPTLEYSRDGLPDWDYAVSVTRTTQPERYEIYTATLQKRLPRFRLPLAVDDRDTVLDLQTVFTRCYDKGGFRERINYCADPPVPLSEEENAWVDSMLIDQKLRGPASPEEVRVAAYHIWEQEGRPVGRDLEHWHKALIETRRLHRNALDRH